MLSDKFTHQDYDAMLMSLSKEFTPEQRAFLIEWLSQVADVTAQAEELALNRAHLLQTLRTFHFVFDHLAFRLRKQQNAEVEL